MLRLAIQTEPQGLHFTFNAATLSLKAKIKSLAPRQMALIRGKTLRRLNKQVSRQICGPTITMQSLPHAMSQVGQVDVHEMALISKLAQVTSW